MAGFGVATEDSIDRLGQFLRDHRTGAFDERLFDLLHDLAISVGTPDGGIDIVCGYRTPWSNEFLRRTPSGMALHSLHMQGEAIDIRIPGISTSRLRDAALALHRGGVGFSSIPNLNSCMLMWGAYAAGNCVRRAVTSHLQRDTDCRVPFVEPHPFYRCHERSEPPHLPLPRLCHTQSRLE